jgi:flagellar biosynthesis chaperone FliJ
MPFHYRLQKILDFRIKKKEEQLQVVILAQQEVHRIEGLIIENKKEIASTAANMRKADFMMLEAYDNYLKHLYQKEEDLYIELQKAIELVELEKAVKVLEKHKERALEAYKEEEKNIELKRLSEVAVQKHFAKTKELTEEEMLEELKQIEGENP